MVYNSLVRHTDSGRLNRNVQPWPDSLLTGYHSPTEREVAARERIMRIVSIRLEIRFGPDSDVAQMLGLVS